ncbi:ribonucleoside-diphosphate reductase [Inquilinus sp. OTU3971]|uniref:ribonucleoside-diphosphate reductase n=1 Tax=Inquilinus sp. OTU3971 TaxID=3043855 RepID=UPI00313C1425
MPSHDTLPPARSYFAGIGQAVADRTVNRKITNPETGEVRTETWADVAERVALGNALLDPENDRIVDQFAGMHHHLRQASLLMSGRHLQHGDHTQPTRNIEVFTNCATAATSALLFTLLLNGAGVGRSYDDPLMIVDLAQLPTALCVIDWSHADVQSGRITGYMTRRDVEHLYSDREIIVHEVEDSREGWAKAVELMERLAFEGVHREKVLILDFSKVRPNGSPIRGMQNRPASGPGPLMAALANVARIRDAGMEPWRQALYADHYLAECVLVGGARRAARMATKSWRDPSVLKFINVKRGGFLWSANNSITVDEDFWTYVQKIAAWLDDHPGRAPAAARNFVGLRRFGRLALHAWQVFLAVTEAAYGDGTGEPGFINQHLLTQKNDGFDRYLDGRFAGSKKFQIDEETVPLMKRLAAIVAKLKHTQITNPCGEISLLLLGGYCVIADVVPFHAQNDDDAEDAFRVATRALIRTNLMDALYKRETERTNRIGVGITGLHEWIFARFGLGFRDIVAEDPDGELMLDANGEYMVKPHPDAMRMWLTLARFARAVSDEARAYSEVLGVVVPHTDRTIKPAGTTSKLFGLTEGAHLPAMREYLRWVQFRNDDPLVAEYEAKGYPVKRLQTYSGTTIVGFPTAPVITQLGMGDKLVTAPEATPEEQYRYLRLLETFWIRGVDEDLWLMEETGNQVSYTLKYDPKVVSLAEFRHAMLSQQSKVRCASVMPAVDTTAYEYQPEQPVSKHEFEMIAAAIIADDAKEDVDFAHVDCGTGACPVDFDKEAA